MVKASGLVSAKKRLPGKMISESLCLKSSDLTRVKDQTIIIVHISGERKPCNKHADRVEFPSITMLLSPQYPDEFAICF